MAPPSYEEIRRFVDFRLLPSAHLPSPWSARNSDEIASRGNREGRFSRQVSSSCFPFGFRNSGESSFLGFRAFEKLYRWWVTQVETVVHDSGEENSGSIIVCRLMAEDGNREQWNDGRAWNSKDPEENFWPIGASVSSKRIKAVIPVSDSFGVNLRCFFFQ